MSGRLPGQECWGSLRQADLAGGPRGASARRSRPASRDQLPQGTEPVLACRPQMGRRLPSQPRSSRTRDVGPPSCPPPLPPPASCHPLPPPGPARAPCPARHTEVVRLGAAGRAGPRGTGSGGAEAAGRRHRQGPVALSVGRAASRGGGPAAGSLQRPPAPPGGPPAALIRKAAGGARIRRQGWGPARSRDTGGARHSPWHRSLCTPPRPLPAGCQKSAPHHGGMLS
mmetsp:Transcript_18468/g.51717  ORF Transcript_18468/g.51717 Transcript_18468/m.51717 type:complete len:227 (-) Transcript_18468:909-1589(-)